MLSNETVISFHVVPVRTPSPHPSAFQTPYSPLFSSLLCLFFLRTPGRAPGSPAAEALFHRPQYWPPVLFGQCFCPPPPSVLLPSPPLPQLVNLWPGPTRIPLRSALRRSLRALLCRDCSNGRYHSRLSFALVPLLFEACLCFLEKQLAMTRRCFLTFLKFI